MDYDFVSLIPLIIKNLIFLIQAVKNSDWFYILGLDLKRLHIQYCTF